MTVIEDSETKETAQQDSDFPDTEKSDDEIENELWVSAEENRLASFGKPGETVCFGRYPQEDLPEDIEWLVFEADENKSLLLSRHALDCRPYHTDLPGTEENNDDICTWLNDSFLKQAFTPEEQKALVRLNSEAPDLGAGDRVFLLNKEEAGSLFHNSRICRATSYAVKRGAFVDAIGNCWWWLKSDLEGNSWAVSSDGTIKSFDGDTQDCAVRPAIWIDRNLIPSSITIEKEACRTEQNTGSSSVGKIAKIAAALIAIALAVSACNGLKLF